jgi:hypothetical protein
MNIPLETIDVWEIDGEFDAPAFFLAVPIICAETDVLVIGSYNPPDEVREWLLVHQVPINRKNARTPFSIECFDVNRREYPHGHAYALHAEGKQVVELSLMAKRKGESADKDLFFDHVLAYRQGEPLLPLMDYHDAFFGGTLLLSGLFAEEAAQGFAQSMGAKANRARNPVLSPWPVENVS